MPSVLEGELQNLALVEKNEFVIDEESLLEEKQVEKQHPKLIMENVLVRVEDFYFPIESLTFGMVVNRHVSNLERPSITLSRVWVDAENGEMTLLVGEEKMKFNLHLSNPLSDEERRVCMKIERSLLLNKEDAPKILQEDTLEGYKFEANSFPTEELAFELTLPIPEVEEVILTSNEDEDGLLVTMDEGPKRRCRTSLTSLARL